MNIPYVITSNHLDNFKNSVLGSLLHQEQHNTAASFLHLSHEAERVVARYHLAKELDKFRAHNNTRITSIHALVDRSVMHLFEAHLQWLNDLAEAISTLNPSKLPELYPDNCVLGHWLSAHPKTEGERERFKEIDRLHRDLHMVAKWVNKVIQTLPINYHYLLMLLKNADRFSLAIGLELAIINNVRFIEESSKDPLTGVLNRQLFFDIFRSQYDISRAVEKSFGMIMADIDNFKQINDKYGHQTGDKVLKAFAGLLLEQTRKSDFVIRFGGEEFVILLPITSLEESREIGEKLQKMTLNIHIDANDETITFTASFGVTCMVPKKDEAPSQALLDALLEEADSKLYRAKQSGKNRVI